MSMHDRENAYWISQVWIALVATAAAVFAYIQIRAHNVQVRDYKLFEMLKYLESQDIRRSRRIVMRKIYPRKLDEWWTDDEDLESAASDVCASYDILGRMIEADPSGAYREFFAHHWARSIVDNHDALEGFLRFRRQRISDAYSAFTKLAVDARHHAGIVPGSTFQSK
jgi:hypothetical protein